MIKLNDNWDEIKESLKYERHKTISLAIDLENYDISKLKEFLKLVEGLGKKVNVSIVSVKEYLYEDEDILRLKEISNVCSLNKVNNIRVNMHSVDDIESIVIAKQKIDEICNKVNNAMITDIKGVTRKLTTGEKFMVLYSYTSNRVYKQGFSAHDWLGVLTTDYAVCAGFASLLNCLCEKTFGKNSREVLCLDQNSMVYGQGPHGNNMVYLKDEHYGVDGFYYCDSCWDHKTSENFEDIGFKYCLRTFDDVMKNISNVEFRHNCFVYGDHYHKYKGNSELNDVILNYFGYPTLKELNNKIKYKTDEEQKEIYLKFNRDVNLLKDRLDKEKERILLNKRKKKILEKEILFEPSKEFNKKHPEYKECLNKLIKSGDAWSVSDIDMEKFMKVCRKLRKDLNKELASVSKFEKGDLFTKIYIEKYNDLAKKKSDITGQLCEKEKIMAKEIYTKLAKKIKEEHFSKFNPDDVPFEMFANGILASGIINGDMSKEEALDFCKNKIRLVYRFMDMEERLNQSRQR